MRPDQVHGPVGVSDIRTRWPLGSAQWRGVAWRSLLDASQFVTIMMERCGRSMECIATKLEGSADDVLMDVAGSLTLGGGELRQGFHNNSIQIRDLT